MAASGAFEPCKNTLGNMFKDQFVTRGLLKEHHSKRKEIFNILLTLLAVIALSFSHRNSNLLKSMAVYQMKSKILATLRTIGLVWKHQIN